MNYWAPLQDTDDEEHVEEIDKTLINHSENDMTQSKNGY